MLSLAVTVAGSSLADWPQWRGTERDGISREGGWLKEGATVRTVWEASVGAGYSCPVIQGGNLYTAGNRDNSDTVVCLDAAKGSVRWQRSYPCRGGSYPGPRATPILDGKRVYMMSRDGRVLAMDADTGAVEWQRELASDPGCVPPQWGFASSPLVLGKALMLNAGSHGVALDKVTGRTLWASGKDGAGYASVVAFKRAGKELLLVFAAKALVAVDPATGAARWSLPWQTSYDVNAADPVAWGDKVLITSGYNRGGALLQITDQGPKTLWENQTIASHFGSPVLWEGHIYATKGNTGGGQVCCVDPATGNALWTRKEAGFCSMALADGKLVMINERGTLMVADAVHDGYRERLNAKVLDGTCWTMPVVSGGLVYVRNDKGRLLALDLAGKAGTP